MKKLALLTALVLMLSLCSLSIYATESTTEGVDTSDPVQETEGADETGGETDGETGGDAETDGETDGSDETDAETEAKDDDDAADDDSSDDDAASGCGSLIAGMMVPAVLAVAVVAFKKK